MRTDAFASAPAAPNAPAPAAPSVPNASPAPAQLNQGETPKPAPVPTPTPPVTAPAAPPASDTTTAPAVDKAPKAPKGEAKAAKTTKEPHMPPVGTVTKDNPTGAPVASQAPGSNSAAQDEAMQGLMATVAELGQAAGQGANSLGELALTVCTAAKNGTISAATSSEDVAMIYAAFRKAKVEAQVDATGDKEAEKDDKTQVATLRVFAKLGAADWKGNAPVILAKARTFINEKLPRAETGKSAYSSLKIFARAQLKAIKQDEKSKPLTNEQIKSLLVKPDAGEDERSHDEYARDELAGIMKKIVKLRDGNDERPGFDNTDVDRAYELINRVKLSLDKKIAPPEAE
ncbi:hypothetical protein PQI07_22730 [Methylobacterium sp. 092160098-2]|uniref:hypothetical protein n=1 Tax=Methylobacterium sp. 092160098-2 TaxID=3025129 RepID=UPI002381B454|nr:hypothetical protein [Methylobacterium sp. 092160098-2]MDE4913500.1 hypothetical protein [Methylobacterium sp. 092160098-2]